MRASTFLFSLVAVGCTTQLPPPRQPLVATRSESRPPLPPRVEVRAPDFPRVHERRGPAGKLWYVTEAGHEGVWVRVQTRRGEDGAYGYGLASLTTTVLAAQLERVFGEDRVVSGTGAHGAFVQVGTTADRLDFTLGEFARVLDGPPPPPRLVREERNFIVKVLEHTDESPSMGAVQAARDQVHGRASSLEEGLRHFQSLYRGYDPAQVTAARDERFAPSDRVIIVTGRVDQAALVAAFERHFGAPVADPPRRPAHRPARVMPERAALSRPMPFPQAYVVFARPAPPIDAPERLVYELIVDLLGGTFGSRLNGALRQEHSYTYGAHANIDSSRLTDVLFIRAAFHPPMVQGALEDLFHQLRGLRSTRFSEGEVAAARLRLWARVQAALDGSGLPSMLARAWQMRTVPRILEEQYGVLADATPELLRSVAQRWFAPEEGVLVITGNFHRIGGWLVRRTSSGFYLVDD